jgi:hypothetical protein
VLEKSLAGTLGLYVKFSTLQEYGVDRVFFLENDNVDSTQRNVVFLVRGEKHRAVKSVAGKHTRLNLHTFVLYFGSCDPTSCVNVGGQSRLNRRLPLYLISQNPKINVAIIQHDLITFPVCFCFGAVISMCS